MLERNWAILECPRDQIVMMMTLHCGLKADIALWKNNPEMLNFGFDFGDYKFEVMK